MVKITLAMIVFFLFMWFIADPITDDFIDAALATLGSDSICPEEFNSGQNKVCFNAEGDVIVDGLVDDSMTITIEGTTSSCRIKTGNYDFEYSGCSLDKFKQVEAYNLLLISNTGKISIKGSNLLSNIMTKKNIVKLSPKGVRWFKKAKYFLFFI